MHASQADSALHSQFLESGASSARSWGIALTLQQAARFFNLDASFVRDEVFGGTSWITNGR